MDNDNQELNEAEALEEEQEQINQDSNKKVVKVAAKTAAEVYAPSVGGKVVDIASQTNAGNQILETGGNVVSKINKTVPFGNAIQEQINKADESGALDAADSAVDMLGGDASSALSGTSDTAPKALETTAGVSESKEKSESAFDLSLFGKKQSGIKSPKGLKKFSLPTIIMGGVLLLFFVFFILAFGSLTDLQLDLTDGEKSAYAATQSNLTISSEQIEKNLIYVGDSRIIDIKNTLSKDNITFIAEEGVDYN